MLRPAASVSRRRLLLGLGAATAALAVPGAALAAAPISPVLASTAPQPAAPQPAVRPAGAAAAAIIPPAVAPPAAAVAPPPGAERWLQNYRPTNVWADPSSQSVVATAPQWSYFRIVGTPVKGRIPVFDPRFGAQVWVDGTTVGPSGPPPAPAAPPAPVVPKATFEPFWVAPFRAAPLLLDSQADSPPVALIDQFAPIKVTGPARNNFYPVEEPFAKAAGWIEAAAIGKVGEPLAAPANRWWGNVVTDHAFGRSEPNRAAPVVATYARGQLLGFTGWAEGEQVTWDDPAWGQVADGVFVYGRLTRPMPLEVPPPPQVPAIPSGRWIGINRTVQIVVAYEDDKPRFWARTSTGRPGWETPIGTFSIIRRAAKETMDSATLVGKDADRAKYKIEDVRYTQYFTNDGNAIHENWWKDPDTFGLPSSHGCAGLPSRDALKFWDFGEYGMPVIVHL